MADLAIRFSCEYMQSSHFGLRLTDTYGRYVSSFFPIYITSDSKDIVENGYIDGMETFNYRVVEANEDPELDVRELAKIEIREFSGNVHIAFKGMQEAKKRWYEVEKLVKRILIQLYQDDFKILSIVPSDFLPDAMIQHTTKQEEKAFDMALAKWESEHGPIRPSGKLSSLLEISSSKPDNEPEEELKIGDDLSDNLPKYGTYRDLTKNDVRTIIELCRAFQAHGGTIRFFYNDHLPDRYQGKFELETLKSWFKNKKFNPKA